MHWLGPYRDMYTYTLLTYIGLQLINKYWLSAFRFLDVAYYMNLYSPIDSIYSPTEAYILGTCKRHCHKYIHMPGSQGHIEAYTSWTCTNISCWKFKGLIPYHLVIFIIIE